MRTKLSLFLAVIIMAMIVVGCQVPQYTPPADTVEMDEDENANKAQDVTAESEASEKMTEEERIKEEFKKKLLEKQKEIQAQEETKTEEVTEETMAEEVKEETKTDEIKEETMTEEEEKPVVETEPAQETTSSKVVSEISKGATGKPTMYLKEGDLVKLKLKATDPDGDMLTYSFARPLDENGEWQTTYGDEGRYAVTIKVSDGTYEVEQEILLMVQSVNKAPVLERMSDIDIKEGETVVLTLKATDLDGDTLSYTISGWMTSSTYKTEFNDAGEHTVKVCVSDGKQEDCNTIKITVNDVNRPPVFEI